MKPKVLINRPIPKEVEDYIGTYCEYKLNTALSRNDLLQEVQEIDGLLTAGEVIDRELLEAATNLKVVSNISVGYNNFDIEEMRKYNVVGTHTPYILDDTVADIAFGLMLSTARRIPELDRYVKAGNWKKVDDPFIFGSNVHGSKLGIIGMGRIGRVLAKRAIAGFNMDVIYHNRSRVKEMEDYGVVYGSLEEVLQQSDFVVLLVPLTNETKHYLRYEHFKLMKSSGIFINISRGQTIDESGLIRALEEGEILAAGLDVFYEEPTSPNNPLLKMENVVVLPHIGTATYETREDMALVAAQNLVNVLVRDKKNAYIVKELQ